MLTIAACVHMRGDPIALDEDSIVLTVSRTATSARAKLWGTL